jgi:predicted kinase
MPTSKAVLHLICGRPAAGKSTLAARLAQGDLTLCISEDNWLATLYKDQMHSLQDYVLFSARLRQAMAPHIIELLQTGVSVVLDFPANTRDNRNWMRTCAKEAGAETLLHLLDVDEGTCWQRLEKRNAQGTHPFQPSREQFIQICKHYAPPPPEEGFAIRIHRPE